MTSDFAADILLATSNPGKAAEIGSAMHGLPLSIRTLADFPALELPPEDGQNYADNAAIKAVAACLGSGLPALADDSGLEVEALAGRPGIHSARFAGQKATTEENNRLLLQLMRHLPPQKRLARFVAVICLCLPDGRSFMTEGKCCGHIADRPQGGYGFGYDPLFIPLGYEQTFAELGDSVKQRISHRAQAIAAMVALLKDVIGGWK